MDNPQDQGVQYLSDAGIAASTDKRGVLVKQADAARAREALLTDKRFVGSGVMVLIGIDAGTVERTEAGYVLKNLDAGDNYRVRESEQLR